MKPTTGSATPLLSPVSFTPNGTVVLVAATSGLAYWSVSVSLLVAASFVGARVTVMVRVMDCRKLAVATTRTVPDVRVFAIKYPCASMTTPVSSARYRTLGFTMTWPSLLYATAFSGTALPVASRSVSWATSAGYGSESNAIATTALGELVASVQAPTTIAVPNSIVSAATTRPRPDVRIRPAARPAGWRAAWRDSRTPGSPRRRGRVSPTAGRRRTPRRGLRSGGSPPRIPCRRAGVP